MNLGLLERHPKRALEKFSRGEASPSEYRRLASHARGCQSCAESFERVTLARRMLERGDLAVPTEDELALIGEAGLGAALRGAKEPRARWAYAFGALGVLATATLVVLVVQPLEDEWASRGGERTRAALRVFCAEPGAALRELGSGGSCPVGAKLGFAAGALPPLRFVTLQIGAQTEGPFEVSGKPGAEVPLASTPELGTPGPLEVRAVFARSSAGEGADPALRLTIDVEAKP